MDKCRVIYKPDGSVVTVSVSEKKRLPGESDSELLDRLATKAVIGTEYEGLPFDDVPMQSLPPKFDKDGNHIRDKWRSKNNKGVFVDNSIVTVHEKIKNIEKQINDEFLKPDDQVNLVTIARLKRKLEKKEYD